MTSKDLYLSYDTDAKKVVFLCVKKNFSLIDACKVIYQYKYCRYRQKAYELRKKHHIEKVIEEAKKNIISIEDFADSEIPATVDTTQIRKVIQKKIISKNKSNTNNDIDIDISINKINKNKIKEVLKKITNKHFVRERVDPEILTQNANSVRKELVKIYLNVEGNWTNDQRLKALDMLAKSLSMYDQKQIMLEMNLLDISDGELKRLISNLSQNLPAEIDLNQNDLR